MSRPPIHDCPDCACGKIELSWSDRRAFVFPDDAVEIASAVASCALDHSYDRTPTGVPYGLPYEQRDKCAVVVNRHLSAFFPEWRDTSIPWSEARDRMAEEFRADLVEALRPLLSEPNADAAAADLCSAPSCASIPTAPPPETLALTLKSLREDDGRWIAAIEDLPGCMAYGATEDEARRNCEALALRTLGDRVEHGEQRLLGLRFANPSDTGQACRICRCTATRPCDLQGVPCHWWDPAHTLCSGCIAWVVGSVAALVRSGPPRGRCSECGLPAEVIAQEISGMMLEILGCGHRRLPESALTSGERDWAFGGAAPRATAHDRDPNDTLGGIERERALKIWRTAELLGVQDLVRAAALGDEDAHARLPAGEIPCDPFAMALVRHHRPWDRSERRLT